MLSGRLHLTVMSISIRKSMMLCIMCSPVDVFACGAKLQIPIPSNPLHTSMFLFTSQCDIELSIKKEYYTETESSFEIDQASE